MMLWGKSHFFLLNIKLKTFLKLQLAADPAFIHVSTLLHDVLQFKVYSTKFYRLLYRPPSDKGCSQLLSSWFL